VSSRLRLRRLLIAVALIGGTVLAGYLVTLAIFPAPILPRQVAVPQLRAAATDSAMQRLDAVGLRGRVVDSAADAFAPPGTIAWQSPVEGTMLPEGAVVQLAVSNGQPPVTVPDVAELDIGLAREVIAAAGLRTGRVDTVRQESEAGAVVGTVPPAGTPVRPGATIAVTVSSGPPSIRVPGVVGLSVAVARERLAAAGLRVGALDQRFEGKPGTVLAQRPVAGEEVTPGSGVDLTISGAMP